MIRENLDTVEAKIREACTAGGRKREEVRLIAVSKTKPVGMLKEAYDCGCRDFGENKVQELTEKYDKLPKDIRWHMIGHLQRNKVKYIIDKVYLIHSVDSLRLAEEIIAAVVNQLIQKRGLVYIYIAVVSKLLKILYAYGEFHISYGLLSVSLYLPLLYAACRRREVYTYLI